MQDVILVTDANGVTRTAAVAVGAGISVTPNVAIVSPLSTIVLTAAGGSGTGYVWSMITNASGGSIDEVSGVYSGGPSADVVDVVRVTDSLRTPRMSRSRSATPSSSPRSTVRAASWHPDLRGRRAAVATSSSRSRPTPRRIQSTRTPVSTWAGANPNVVDRVQAADNIGNLALVEVTVGAGITVTPSTLTLEPAATTTFSVAGGSGAGYAWSLTAAPFRWLDRSLHGGLRGRPRGGTDTVQVRDSLGNVATATVTVPAPPGSSGTGDAGAGADAGGDDSGGCSAAPKATSSAWLALLIAGLLLRRSRARA